MNKFIGTWASLYRVILNTYFDGVTFTLVKDGNEERYSAEKDGVIVTSKSVVDLERKMFQKNMDII